MEAQVTFKGYLLLEHNDLWDKVASLQKQALIGKWLYSEDVLVDMSKWVKNYWCPMLGYIPKVSNMMGNWFSVHFLHEEDCRRILECTSVRGRSFMQLMPWFLGFNPDIDAPKSKLVWVKVPGLPLEFWTTYV